ncbi:IS5 family transposase [Variovorax ginsengisoli]|uniref:IS5 family transposase n=1 Tax=Variovorax ginsengisoli TaxID=363844 RepID=A0ABT8SDN6_9BURK|nr:IS5 family transposase [Variovorax ginsengisoli]MDN8617353.1 IS5 family transposase [Variovorax ginsengisoli]MDO1536523.1 IS5 family transposase [Variovorax ginsengisoli]
MHKRFLEWEKDGLFEALWKAGLAEYDQMEVVAWRWQSVDGAMFKRQWPRKRSGGTRPIGKNKCHLLVDGRGVPLSFIVTAANVNDITMLDAVQQAIAVTRQQPPHRRSKHLCADAGYRSRAGLETINAHGYIPHVVDRRQESQRKRRDPKKKAQRWVEVCHSWFNRFRKLLVRYEKTGAQFRCTQPPRRGNHRVPQGASRRQHYLRMTS